MKQIIKKCLFCQKQFVAKTNQRKFCSLNCIKYNWRKVNREKDLASRRDYNKRRWQKVKPQLIEKKCEYCNKIFTSSRKNYQRFCSSHCRNCYNIKKRKRLKPEVVKKEKTFRVMARRFRIKANGGKFTLREWEKMKDDYNHACNFCHKFEPEIKLTIDHIIPLTKGGKHDASNIQPLCMDCNVKKGTKLIAVVKSSLINGESPEADNPQQASESCAAATTE